VVPEPCPVCGAYVTAKSKRGTVTFECSADKEHDTSAIGAAAETSEAVEAADEREPDTVEV
jgi:hypothetical protein